MDSFIILCILKTVADLFPSQGLGTEASAEEIADMLENHNAVQTNCA